VRQLSLVAFHGNKPSALRDLLADCRETVSTLLGDRFAPYEVEQTHATLIGLESLEDDPGHNRNLARNQGVRVRMKIPGFLEHVREVFRGPMTIRFGGFAQSSWPFSSRGQTPYDRGFSIQGDRVVLMGWPTTPGAGADEWPQTLADLRRAASAFGIGHAYHVTEHDRDNDFYLRLGLVVDPLDDASRREVETRLRTRLAEGGPHRVELTAGGVTVVDYEDETLPLGSTRRRAL